MKCIPAEMEDDYASLNCAINKRSSYLQKQMRERGIEVLDAYHGEMRYTMTPAAGRAIRETTTSLINETAVFTEEDGSLFSKSQPKILRRLAAQWLFPQFQHAGLRLRSSDVIVCPYSSTVMLEAVLATVYRPGGVVLCPRGFYKNNSLHVAAKGLRIECFDVDIKADGRLIRQN